MAVKTQTIRFVMDVARAVRDLEKLNNGLDKIRSKSRGGSTRIYGGGSTIVSGLPEISSSVGNLAGKFAMLSTAALGLYATFRAVNYIAEHITKAGILVEGSITQMTSFIGSNSKARSLVKEAIADSLKTPFTPVQAIGATMKATQFGMDPYAKGAAGLQNNKSAMDIINALGTFSDASGKMLGPERAIWAITQGNKRLLRPYGPDVLAAYEKSYQTGGALGSGGQIKAFMVELSKMSKIFNLAKDQAETVAGLWSTISGYADEFFIALTGAVEDKGVVTMWSQLRDILKDIRDYGYQFLIYAKPYITEIGSTLFGVFTFIWKMLKNIGEFVAPVIIPAFKMLVQLLRMAGQIIQVIFTLITSLTRVFFGLLQMPLKMLNLLFDISTTIDDIISRLMEFVAGLQVTFQTFTIYIDGLFNRMQNFMLKHEKTLKNIAKAIIAIGVAWAAIKILSFLGNILINLTSIWLFMKSSILTTFGAWLLEMFQAWLFSEKLTISMKLLAAASQLWKASLLFLNAHPLGVFLLMVGSLVYLYQDLKTNWELYSAGFDALITRQISNLMWLKKAIYEILYAVGLLSEETLAGATQDYMRSLKDMGQTEDRYASVAGWKGELTAKGLKGKEDLRRRGLLDENGHLIRKKIIRNESGGVANPIIYNDNRQNFNYHPVSTPYINTHDQSGAKQYSGVLRPGGG